MMVRGEGGLSSWLSQGRFRWRGVNARELLPRLVRASLDFPEPEVGPGDDCPWVYSPFYTPSLGAFWPRPAAF